MSFERYAKVGKSDHPAHLLRAGAVAALRDSDGGHALRLV